MFRNNSRRRLFYKMLRAVSFSLKIVCNKRVNFDRKYYYLSNEFAHNIIKINQKFYCQMKLELPGNLDG